MSTRAKKIELFFKEGDEVKEIQRFKGIVNEEKMEQIFSVVGVGYTIIQHEDVINAVKESLKDLGLRAEDTILELNEGGRLRMNLIFPDIKINVGPKEIGDLVTLRMSFDNSYDGTTGMRSTVNGMRRGRVTVTPDKLARHYHKHTKNIDINKIAPTIQKGVDVFQNEVKKKWDDYFYRSLNPDRVKTFLEECMEDKVIPKKYLELMKEQVSGVSNQWDLLNVITDVIDSQGKSEDSKEEHMEKMDKKINSSINQLI